MTESFAVPFEVVEGLILIDATIDNQQGSFIFDTGSSEIFINEKQSEGDVQFYTAEGTFWAKEYQFNSFKIGELQINRVNALKMDLSHVSDQILREVKGIIGWSVLGDNTIIIDYENNKLIISPHRHYLQADDIKEKHLLKMDMATILDDLPIIDVQLKNQKLQFAFDTGAPLNIIDHKLANSIKSSILYIDDMYLERGTKIENSLFRSEDLERFSDQIKGQKLDGILSVNSLNADKVIIDRRTSRIFVIWDREKSNTNNVAALESNQSKEIAH